jgi:hypothetical protein
MNQIKKEIINNFNFYYYDNEWQKPVITEYRCFQLFYQHKNIPNNYFAFPWASLIDSKLKNKKMLNNFKITDSSCFTVIQHIHFRKYLDIIKNIGITHIFTPHKSNTDYLLETKYNIKISAFPLFPAQDSNGKILPINDRKYLTSFIGQYMEGLYISDIRLKIFNLFSNFSDCKVIRRNEWHYEKIVYKNAKNTNKSFEEEFKDDLKNSKFSLCPSGSGPNSIRIWESMSFGSIPVILADTLILPEIPDINWNDCFILHKETEINSLYDSLKKLENNKENMNYLSDLNIQLFNKYFSKDKIINTILVNYNKNII